MGYAKENIKAVSRDLRRGGGEGGRWGKGGGYCEGVRIVCVILPMRKVGGGANRLPKRTPVHTWYLIGYFSDLRGGYY